MLLESLTCLDFRKQKHLHTPMTRFLIFRSTSRLSLEVCGVRCANQTPSGVASVSHSLIRARIPIGFAAARRSGDLLTQQLHAIKVPIIRSHVHTIIHSYIRTFVHSESTTTTTTMTARYEGGYVGDRKVGEGKFSWPDGRCYVGQWEGRGGWLKITSSYIYI